MKKPGLRDIVYVVSGIWFITVGLQSIVGVVQKLRK